MVGPTACARSAHRPPLYATTLPSRAKYPPTSDVFGSGSSGRGARAKCTAPGRAPRRQRPGAHTGKTLAFWPWRPPGHTGTGTQARAHARARAHAPGRAAPAAPTTATAPRARWRNSDFAVVGQGIFMPPGRSRAGRTEARPQCAAYRHRRHRDLPPGARGPGSPRGHQRAPNRWPPPARARATRQPGRGGPGAGSAGRAGPLSPVVPIPTRPAPRPHSGHRDRAGRRRPGGPAARTRPDELTGKRRSPRRSRAAPAAAGLQGLRDRRERSRVGPGRCWLLAGRRAGPGAGAVRWRHRQPVRRAGWPTPSPVQGPQVGRLAGGTGGRLRAAGRPVATLAGTPGPPSRAFGRHRAYRPTRRALLPQGQRLKFN